MLSTANDLRTQRVETPNERPNAGPLPALELLPVGNYHQFMPIYEFHCEQCAQDSEIIVRSSDWKGTKCPHCGSTKLSKKFSVFASATAGQPSAPSCGATSGGCCCGGGPHRH